MQRKIWGRPELSEFLVKHGMTPQVASRRISEVNRSYMAAMAEGYQELSENDLYNEEEKKIYATVAKEMMSIARKH